MCHEGTQLERKRKIPRNQRSTMSSEYFISVFEDVQRDLWQRQCLRVTSNCNHGCEGSYSRKQHAMKSERKPATEYFRTQCSMVQTWQILQKTQERVTERKNIYIQSGKPGEYRMKRAQFSQFSSKGFYNCLNVQQM